ncbi:hypothetical protein [Mycoplasma sp. 1654_15]|uniref:hypothetical protein n=1 Tax=Mycoplasma sp. 1654_15 TaxID=2725994 RepID=UPI0015978F5A|nr:hypothetical protein [Mycoplasma sp. 1654_15]QKG28162.1 hypothetical protein HF996_00770 [Mycoplasma sp. 1654_15]
MVKIRKFNKIIFFSLTLIASTFALISCSNNVSNNENKNKDMLDNKIEILKNKENLEKKIDYFSDNFLDIRSEQWNQYLQIFNSKTYWLSNYSNKIFDRGYLTPEEINLLKREEEKNSSLKIPFSYNEVMVVKNSQDIKKLDKSKVIPTLNKYISDTFRQKTMEEVFSNYDIYILKSYYKGFSFSTYDHGVGWRLEPFFKFIKKTKKLYIIDTEWNNGKHSRDVKDFVGHEGQIITIFSIPKDQNITLFPSYDIADIVKDISK